MCQTVEVVFHAFYFHHELSVAIHGEGIVLQGLCSHGHLLHLSYLCEHGVIGSHRLPFHGHHLQLWVEGGEEGGHEVMESIEHAERHHQSHSSYCHPHHTDGADDIDGVGTLLREEVTLGDVKGEVHLRYSSSLPCLSPLSNWSICSI